MFTPPPYLDPAMYDADLSPPALCPILPGFLASTLDMSTWSTTTLAPATTTSPPPSTTTPAPTTTTCSRPPTSPPHHPPPRRLRYKCVFRIAGCPFSFRRKSDWIRHVHARHLNQSHYWICTEGACPLSRDRGTENIFMLKDIYIQHLRRGHGPPRGTPPWDAARLVATAEAAFRRRYTLPEAWGCAAAGCGE